MRILLDTHILLWSIYDYTKLSGQARLLLEDLDNEVYYSVVSLWEIAIKHARRPDVFPFDPNDVALYGAESGFFSLPLIEEHALLLDALRRRDGAPP